MKKVYAFLMMAAALVACTREEQPRTETPDQPQSPVTYTLSIQASKGQDTRALVLNGNTLNATWGGSEQVLVYANGNPDQVIATLTPDPNGQTGSASCMLVGDFSQLPGRGDVLTLKLNSNNYSDQRGTLAYIADNCDYAVATLHVTGVDNGQILSSEGGAEFESQQAIVKFSLKNDAGTAINPTSLTVQVSGTPVATVNQIPVINADVVTGFSLCVLLVVVFGIGKDTYIPLVLGHVTLCAPFVYLSVIPKLKQMDSSLYEAALDLGAKPRTALFKVVIPQILSGMISGFSLAVTLSLDDYFIATYTKPATFDTISTYVVNATKGSQTQIKTALWALSTLIFLLVIVIVLVMNISSRRTAQKEDRL